MIVYGKIARGRSITPDNFADITDVPVLGIRPGSNGWFEVEFDGDIDMPTRKAIRRRMGSVTLAEETVRENVRTIGAGMEAWPDMPAVPTMNNLKWRIEYLIEQTKNLTRLIQLLDEEAIDFEDEPEPDPIPDPIPET